MPPAIPPKYRYNSLLKDEFFRLFVLEPGAGRQQLRGSLYTSTLDQAPYYEAISYVWGSSDRCIELICDNQQIFITPSLSHVLHRVRLPDRTRTLWTDSVCIDQEDLDEKGYQVSLMGRIYRRSNRTLIHIGAPDNGHGEFIQGLLNDIDQDIFANLQQEWDSAPILDEDHPLVNDIRWKSVRHLIDTPWFWRGWVVQEAAFAHDGVVLWGNHEFSWTMIMKTSVWVSRRAIQIAQKFGLKVSSLHMSCFSFLNKDLVRPFMPERSWEGICITLDIFHSGRDHVLSDPKDRVYAFYDLPTSDKFGKLQLIPSYHKSFPEVCKDLALKYLEVYGDLDLLLYVSHDEESLAEDFASWIPLWSSEEYPSENFQSSFAKQAPLIEKPKPVFSLRGGGDNLLVSGLRFAKVRMVSEILGKEQLTFEAITSLWSKVCEVQQTETIPCDRLSMFLVTLCFGPRRLDSLENRRHLQNMAAFALKIFQTATGEGKRAIDFQRWETQANGGNAEEFLSWVRITAVNRRFIVTNRGYGMAPVMVQEEDECVIIFGGRAPFLLRKTDGVGTYKFIGHMFHSSKFECNAIDTEWEMSVGLDLGQDWIYWNFEGDEYIEEEEICLI